MNYTDLAIESTSLLRKNLNQETGPLPGISVVEDRHFHHVFTSRITVESEEASQQLMKPCGTYITLETKDLLSENPEVTDQVIEAFSEELSFLLPTLDHLKVLIIGIGNEKITPDSLGPHTVSKVQITRPLFLDDSMKDIPSSNSVAALNPGVMAQTGIETAEIIKQLVDLVSPDVLIAIDALAARDVERMNTTIQMTDTGISPGAGMKNHRTQLSEETVGCPVIAIGVPTVIHCQALLNDPSAPDLIVTATNIDQVIHDFSAVIAKGINRALHPRS